MTHGKQHVKLCTPIQKHVSLLHDKNLKYKKLIAIIKTQNETTFIVPMSLKARTEVRASNPVFKKDMLLFGN